MLVAAYRFVDWNGVISDFIADPQMIYEKYWPYRAIRKALFKDAEPLVSVVMATRNNGETIARAVSSLLEQTHRNLEVIVVDDNSDDDTADIVLELQRTDPRVRYVRNETHRGTGKSRNRGMRMARGAYLTFQDGDDVSHPARIEMQVRTLLKRPDKVLVTCNYVRVTEDGIRLYLNRRRVMECIVSMMFPRRPVLETVGYFRDMSVSEDTEYYERIKIAFGADSKTLIFRTLYHALFRPTSSFFSDVHFERIAPDKIVYDRAPRQAEAYETVKQRLERIRRGDLNVYVEYED